MAVIHAPRENSTQTQMAEDQPKLCATLPIPKLDTAEPIYAEQFMMPVTEEERPYRPQAITS